PRSIRSLLSFPTRRSSDLISLGLDAVGGPAAATIAGALSPGAHFVSYAWLGGLPIHLPQGDLIGKRLNIRGFWMYYEEFLPKTRDRKSTRLNSSHDQISYA